MTSEELNDVMRIVADAASEFIQRVDRIASAHERLADAVEALVESIEEDEKEHKDHE